MKLVRYRNGWGEGLAAYIDGEWRGLAVTHAALHGGAEEVLLSPGRLSSVLETFALEGQRLDMDEITYLAPISSSRKIICVGLNYHDHSAESGFKQPDYPTLFFRVGTSLTAHGRGIVRPSFSDSLDFEGELAAVIGKGGSNIPAADAFEHVAGYSIFNDVTVREYQFKTPQWTVGKNFDGTGAFGPWFVTTDEFPDGGRGRTLETRLNGAVMQRASLDDMVFGLPRLIETISRAITLEPGDVIVTGTPSGVGHARNPRVYMKPGDVVEVEIEGLGVLSNTIIDEPSSKRAA
ncbi:MULTISPECIES: fumarylacetoacetate hydrolase family protein [unclassified Caballeronia]|jgi:2-keto-4-pentenoate hydratase/2-oxohepta-3-ene-1,7-dioic acid hydratase in catechol pathway|uniref:fumarylacetoacetate hydrolase family protein n=1 Tax=unclassified Caballeronia TaxID=2646786 RepID=UPI0020286AF8|nr:MULTISPECIES: fumarylacetoacetate hydrolase family protein [unclassified Caballeronia]